MNKSSKNNSLLPDFDSSLNDECKLVKINAKESGSGIQMEYDYVSEKYGVYNQDWTLVRQALSSIELESGEGVMIDTFFIRLADDSELSIKFDITSFYGR